MNFQPILSTGNTPTTNTMVTPDTQFNPDLNSGNFYHQTSTSSMDSPTFYQPQSAELISVAVGPSKPPSATNSPFVSPRETPVDPFLSRSRSDSGQSSIGSSCFLPNSIAGNISGCSRQTPFQSDSGVSSYASSPFISPQATPVPNYCNPAYPARLRTSSGPLQRAMLNRTRHSSGPGYFSMAAFQAAVSSASSMTHAGSFDAGFQPTMSNNSVFESPSSEPMSPLNQEVLQQEFMPSEPYNHQQQQHVLKAFNRHRHMSSPYSFPSSTASSSAAAAAAAFRNYSRSHSVPINRNLKAMISNSCSMLGDVEEEAGNNVGNHGQQQQPEYNQLQHHQVMDLRRNSFGYSPSPETVTGADGTDASYVNGVRGQDVMVSGRSWIDTGCQTQPMYTKPVTAAQVHQEIQSAGGPRRNINELLNSPPESDQNLLTDDLDTTLEDLRDCDDFSRFARELEAMNPDGSMINDPNSHHHQQMHEIA